MSRTVDQKVVEMEFDNDRFEKGVKESMGTIERLKKSLDFTESVSKLEALNSVGNSINFDGLNGAVETIQKRFSTLGVIGMTVLQNLTNAAVDASKRIVSSAFGTIFSGGKARSMNIEQAKFQLQGLGIAWKDIAGDIDYGVKDTAYSLDAAALVASQLAASGIEIGNTLKTIDLDGTTYKLDRMAISLRGISGVAAMTNSEYSDIGRIFATVAGNGRLMGDQLLQLGTRGLNAAAELASFFNGVNSGSIEATESVRDSISIITGGLESTEESIRDLTSKGLINFEVFSEAMDTAFGQHAKDANNTLTGVLANIRAALSKIGADFWTPIVRNYGPLVQLLEQIRLKINAIRNAIHDNLNWQMLDDGIEYLVEWKEYTDNIFNSLKSIVEKLNIDKINSAIATTVNILKNLVSIGENLFYSIKNIISAISSSFISKFDIGIFQYFLGIIQELSIIFTDLTSKFRDFSKIFKTESNLKNIRKIVAGFTSVIHILSIALQDVLKFTVNISQKMNPLIEKVLYLAGCIGDFIVSIDNAITKNQTFSTILEGISKVLDSVISLFTNFFGLFSSSEAKQLLSISNIFETISKIFDKIASAISSLSPAIIKLGEIVSGIFNTVFDLINKVLDSLSLGEYIQIFNTTLFVGFLENFKYLSTNISKFVTTISNGMSAITGLTTATQVESLQKLATALLIFAAAVVLISSVEPERMYASVGAISILLKELTSVVMQVLSLGSNKKLKSGIATIVEAFSFSVASTGIIKFSLGILVLASAMKKIAEIDPNRLADSFGVIEVLIITMGVVFKALSASSTQAIKGARALVIFAIAIKNLAKAVKIVSDVDSNKIEEALLAITLMMGELMAIAIILGDSEGAMSIGTGVSLIAFSVAITILAKAFSSLSEIPWNKMQYGLLAFSTIIAELLISIAALDSIKTSMFGIGLGIIAFSVGVLVLSKAFEEFSKIKLENTLQGFAALSAALGSIIGFVWAIDRTQKSLIKTGLGLIAFSIGLEILASCMTKIASLSVGGVIKNLVMISSVLGIIVGMVWSLEKTENGLTKVSAGLILFAIALDLMLPALKAFSSMNIAGAAIAIGVLVGILGTLVLATKLLEKRTKALYSISLAIIALGVGCALAGAGMLAFSVGLTGILASLGLLGTGIFNIVSELSKVLPTIFEGFANAIIGFAKVIGEAAPILVASFVSVFASILSVIEQAVPRIVDVIISIIKSLVTRAPELIDSIITLIINIIDKLAERVPELVKSIINFVGKLFQAFVDALKGVDLSVLADAVLKLAAATLMLAGIGKLGAAAIEGLGVLMIVITGLGLFITGLGLLMDYIPDLQRWLDQGIPIMNAIGRGIGEFVGGLVGGVMAGFTSGLIDVAENLSTFMIKLQPFIDGCNSIKPGIGESMAYLAEAILILTGTSIIDGISSWFGLDSNFVSFGEDLKKFGPMLKEFADSVDGLDAGVVENAANAGKAVAEMASALPNSGGLAGLLAGENDLDEFAVQLPIFGLAMTTFASSVKGLDAGVVENAANAGKAIAEMASALPNSGGLAGLFAGENDLITFSMQLVPFGIAMKSFSDEVIGLDGEVVTNAANAGKAIAEMASALPNSGGIVSWFTGNNDMDDFGEQLPKFGTALKDFATNVEGISGRMALNALVATTVGKAVAEMASEIPNTGGIFSWFTGNNDMDDFGKQLPDFGTALKDFATNVNGLSEGMASNAIVAANVGKAIAEMAAGLKDFNSSKMQNLSDKLPAFGTALKDFSSNLRGVNNTAVTDASISGKSVVEMISGVKDFDVYRLQKFIDNLPSFGQALSDFSAKVVNLNNVAIMSAANSASKLVTLFTDMSGIDFPSSEGFCEAMANLADISIDDFVKEFTDSKAEVEIAILDFVNGLITSLSEFDPTFEEKGISNLTCYSNGLTNTAEGIPETLSENIKEILTALANQNEPFMITGEYIMKGFISGMQSMQIYVEQASYAIGKAAIDNLNAATQVQSPSKLAMKSGVYFGQGYVNGIASTISDVSSAASYMGNTSLDSLRTVISRVGDVLDSDMDLNPTITPVLDLSEIQNGIGTMNGYLANGNYQFGGVSSYLARNISYMNSKSQTDAINKLAETLDKAEKLGQTNYNYTQVNNSPKALSRLDIYRNTKNLLSLRQKGSY